MPPNRGHPLPILPPDRGRLSNQRPEKRRYQMVSMRSSPVGPSPGVEGYSSRLTWPSTKSRKRLSRDLLQWRTSRNTSATTRILSASRDTSLKRTNQLGVCHGVEIPAYADCVQVAACTVPKCRFDLEVCGAPCREPCVVDGNLISGRTFHDNGHFVGKWIALLDQARESA